MKKLYSDIINFTRQLVETPSQNGIDSEKRIADLVFKKLSQFGFSPKIVGDKKHPSVFCKINKNSNGKTIWLESCLDTVPVGDLLKWKYPPLEATVKNNKMYGRGAADSKIAIAIFCFLAKELSNKAKFKGNSILGFDSDEQSGEFTGIKNILKQKPKADVCILGYQGIDEISIGARGWLRIKIIAKGKSAHTGARYNKGINAIHQMAEIISALNKIKLNAKKESFFDFGSSLNVSLIQGGTAINIVPDKCEAKIDLRFLPSQTKNKILNKIYSELKKLKKNNPKISYKIEMLQSENAFLTNPKNEFIKLLQQTAKKKLKRKISLTAEGKGSAGNLIAQKNIPIVNSFGCSCGNIHAPNEWIDIKTLPKVFEIYKETILEFCKK
jgi:succinyl-diaminopimelate desuccinylase